MRKFDFVETSSTTCSWMFKKETKSVPGVNIIDLLARTVLDRWLVLDNKMNLDLAMYHRLLSREELVWIPPTNASINILGNDNLSCYYNTYNHQSSDSSIINYDNYLFNHSCLNNFVHFDPLTIYWEPLGYPGWFPSKFFLPNFGKYTLENILRCYIPPAA